MFQHRPRHPRARFLIVAIAGLLISGGAGCRLDRGPEMAPVHGTVSYRGQKLTNGLITFIPDGDGQPATSLIGSDGSYTLQSIRQDDGIRLGSYKVVVVDNLDAASRPAPAPASASTTSAPSAPGAEEEKEAEPPAEPTRLNRVIPERYALPATTPLTAEVAPGTNRIDFNLE